MLVLTIEWNKWTMDNNLSTLSSEKLKKNQFT